MRTRLLALLAIGLSVGFTTWANAAPLRIAADPIPQAEILNYVKKIDPSLELDVIELSGSLNANELLAAGDVDANYWQHLPFLKDQEKALNQTFAVIATVHLEPLGVYSNRLKTLQELHDGATIAVPNNESNLSRALHLLQSYQLITLKPGFDNFDRPASVIDVDQNPHHLKIVELEPSQLPRALDDVDAAIINGSIALNAGLSPAHDAIALESVKNNPYANIVVTTPALKNDPRLQRLAKDLNSSQVIDFINKEYQGSVIPVGPHD